MSQEVPGCSIAKQCIKCPFAGICKDFADEKRLAGATIIDKLAEEV